MEPETPTPAGGHRPVMLPAGGHRPVMLPAGGHRPVMLIVGGSGSIGRVVARQAAEAGWAVAVHGRNPDKVEQALAGLAEAADPQGRQGGASHSGHVADLCATGAMAALVDAVAARQGRIDAVVDCTAMGRGGRVTGAFAATEPEAYAHMAEFSFVALERLAHAALPLLTQAKGTLVALVSDAGRFAAPRQAIIGGARAASIGFVRNLAMEVARDGVRAHAVSLGFVDQTDIARRLAAAPEAAPETAPNTAGAERLAKARKRAGLGLPVPEDVAALVLFLCGPGALRLTGQVISLNGGLNA